MLQKLPREVNCISCILHYAQSDDLERNSRRASPVAYLAQPTFLREKTSLYRRLQRLHQSLRSSCIDTISIYGSSSFEPHGYRLRSSLWLLRAVAFTRSQRSTCHGPYTASILYCRTNIHEKRVRLPDQYPLRLFFVSSPLLYIPVLHSSNVSPQQFVVAKVNH